MLYPGVFPNLSAYRKVPGPTLAAILLTGIPAGGGSGFQNFTGPTPADLLRLNVAVPPSATPNPLGLCRRDPAGFPNGRRVADDVTTIELRAVAGLTIPLVDHLHAGRRGGRALGTARRTPTRPPRPPYSSVPRSGGYPGDPGKLRLMTAVWVENPYAARGPVLLDVGADSAALVITCPEDLVGSEIGVLRLDEPHSEVGQGHHHVGSVMVTTPRLTIRRIHPHGSTGHPPHVAVLRRPAPSGRLVASAVFPDLRPGHYRLWVLPAGSP